MGNKFSWRHFIYRRDYLFRNSDCACVSACVSLQWHDTRLALDQYICVQQRWWRMAVTDVCTPSYWIVWCYVHIAGSWKEALKLMFILCTSVIYDGWNSGFFVATIDQKWFCRNVSPLTWEPVLKTGFEIHTHLQGHIPVVAWGCAI
jgi:hypothetical protein